MPEPTPLPPDVKGLGAEGGYEDNEDRTCAVCGKAASDISRATLHNGLLHCDACCPDTGEESAPVLPESVNEETVSETLTELNEMSANVMESNPTSDSEINPEEDLAAANFNNNLNKDSDTGNLMLPEDMLDDPLDGNGRVGTSLVNDEDIIPAKYLVDPPEVLAMHYLETAEEAAEDIAERVEIEGIATGAAAGGEAISRASAETRRDSRRGLSPSQRLSASSRSSRRSKDGESLRASTRKSGPLTESQKRHQKQAKIIVYGGFVFLTIVFFAAALIKFWHYLAPLIGME